MKHCPISTTLVLLNINDTYPIETLTKHEIANDVFVGPEGIHVALLSDSLVRFGCRVHP